jgi:hypothetical protein
MIFLLSPDQQFPGSGVGATSSISYSAVFRTVKRFFVTKWVHPHVQAIVKNMNDYVFENIDKSDADNTGAASMEDFTDSLQRVMDSLDDDDSESDENAAEAAPPANIGPSISAPATLLPTAPPAPIIASVPLPAPGVAIAPVMTMSATHILTPIPESSQSIPAAVRNDDATTPGSHPATPGSRPAAIPADVAADTVQKKGRRKGKAVTAGTDAPRRSSRSGSA